MEGIRKLSLSRGDILLVDRMETLKLISEMPIHLDFKVPLVFAPGGVKQLKREDLLNLLEQLDQQEMPVLMPLEESTIPI